MPYKSKKINAPKIKKWRKLQMSALGDQAALAIVQRVSAKGHGLDDKRLPKHSEISRGKESLGAYSEGHGKIRRDGGKYNGIRIGGGLPINRVTLSVTGQMMRQFRRYSTATRFKARIGATGPSKKYARFTHAQRPWIGLSKSNRATVRRMFKVLWGRL